MNSISSFLSRNTSPSYQVLPTTSGPSRDDRDDVLLRSVEEEFRTSQNDKPETPSSSPPFDIRTIRIPSGSSLLHIILHVLKSCLLYLIPSFIWNLKAQPNTSRRKLPSTAYLNGVRGLAAFFVFCQHYMTDYYGTERMWGYHSRKQDIWLSQVPFVRLVHSGRFCVTIFYVLSGYVLGYKPLQLIRQKDIPALSNNLISGIFRRGLRLFLPLFPPLVFASFCVWAGWLGLPEHPMRGGVFPSVDGTLWSEMKATVGTFDRVLNPFSQEVFHPRNIPALYTLRVEFRGSILVFTMLLGLAKVKTAVRMLIMSTVAMYSLGHGRWDAFLFISGVVLADLGHIRTNSSLSLEDFTKDARFIRIVRFSTDIFWILAFILSLYLGSYPRYGAKSTPGYITLCAITPVQYQNDEGYASFWCSLGAVLLLASLENFPILQKPFATAFARYMGDISFSIYVFHVPILLTIGRLITPPLVRATGHFNMAFFAGGILLIPFLIVVADLQWRAVDLNSVKVARWLEGVVSS